MGLPLKPQDSCAFDAVALGEIMLRLDPGEGRIRTARHFQAWEGGGEYNVARGLRKCFGLRTAVVTAFVGLPQAWGHIDLRVLLIAVAAALLLPLIPWTLELYALRRLTKSAFGTLMSVEPAIALAIGALVLHQLPNGSQLLGIACVVMAGIAAERAGQRGDELPELASPPA